MQGNGKHKAPARHIAQMQQPALSPTRPRRREDRIDGLPVEAEEEAQGLQEVCDEEVEVEDVQLALVQAVLFAVSRTHHLPGEVGEDAGGRDDGDCAEEAEREHAIVEVMVELEHGFWVGEESLLIWAGY